MLELNKIYNMDCLEGLKLLDDNCIDLTVTSPPYDNLRTYNGYYFDFENIAKELYRVTARGGVVVWVVGDATVKGNETGTSFKQALWFKECGFNLHDTMIWVKDGGGAVGSNKCYTQNFEYMFVFSKETPKTINLIYDKPTSHNVSNLDLTFGTFSNIFKASSTLRSNTSEIFNPLNFIFNVSLLYLVALHTSQGT